MIVILHTTEALHKGPQKPCYAIVCTTDNGDTPLLICRWHALFEEKESFLSSNSEKSKPANAVEEALIESILYIKKTYNTVDNTVA